MRDLATNPENCYKTLGSERGQAFISLLADIRAAIFAGDIPGGPASVARDKNVFKIAWRVASDTLLYTTIAVPEGASSDDDWRDAHRVKIEGVEVAEEPIS